MRIILKDTGETLEANESYAIRLMDMGKALPAPRAKTPKATVTITETVPPAAEKAPKASRSRKNK